MALQHFNSTPRFPEQIRLFGELIKLGLASRMYVNEDEPMLFECGGDKPWVSRRRMLSWARIREMAGGRPWQEVFAVIESREERAG